MSEANSTRLRVTVSALALVAAMTFLSGFLQDTPYNFVNYISFCLLFLGGLRVMSVTVKSTQTRTTKGFLFLTGVSTTLLFILYVGYEWFRLNGGHRIASHIEGIMYLLALCLIVGGIGSLFLIRRRPHRSRDVA